MQPTLATHRCWWHPLLDIKGIFRLSEAMQSTVDAYLRLLEFPAGEARQRAWVDQYEAAHPAIFQTYYVSWGNRARRQQAADTVAALAPEVRSRERRAAALVENAARDLATLGILEDSSIPAVLLVGGHTSNGWVTDLDGEPTLFLALEYLPEPPFDDLLVAHEATHVAHLKLGACGWPDTVAADLIREGVATVVSRALRPGSADPAYLWFDDDHTGWVSECRRRQPEILHAVLTSLHSVDPTVCAELFSAPPGSPLPTRCGYWVGDLVVQRLLARGTTLHQLMSWPYAEAVTNVTTVLQHTD